MHFDVISSEWKIGHVGLVNSILIGCILGLCTWPCCGCVSGSQSTCKDLVVCCLFLLRGCETGYKSLPNVPGKIPKLFPLQKLIWARIVHLLFFLCHFCHLVERSHFPHKPIQVNDSLGPWIRVTDFFSSVPETLRKKKKKKSYFVRLGNDCEC